MKPVTPKNNDAPPTNGRPTGKWASFLNDKPFLLSFIIASFFLLLTYAFFSPHFQFADDIMMLLLSKGVGMVQAPSVFNQRENILLCNLLKELYIHFPQVQWYSLLLVSTQFLSLWAMLAAFQWGAHRGFRTLLFLFASAGIWVYCFDSTTSFPIMKPTPRTSPMLFDLDAVLSNSSFVFLPSLVTRSRILFSLM